MKSLDGIKPRTGNRTPGYVPVSRLAPAPKVRAIDRVSSLGETRQTGQEPMPKKSSNFLGKVTLSSLTVSAVLYGALHFGGGIKAAFDSLTDRGIKLETPALTAGIVQNYLNANAEVTPYVVNSTNEDLVKADRCTGTAIGGDKLSTAAHCMQYLTGKYRMPRAPLEQSVLIYNDDMYFGSKQEQAYTAYTPSSRDFDVDVIDADRSFPASVPLATQKPVVGEAIYVESRYGDDNAGIFGGRIVQDPSSQDADINALFKLPSPERQVCIHGTSGTGVIDQSGDLIGTLVASTEPFTLSSSLALHYGVDHHDVGQQVQDCIIVPVSTLRPLTETR